MKRILVCVIILFFAAVNLAAEDLPKFSFRGSLGSFWNEGWGDKFYFKTFSTFTPGMTLDFNRTLRHTMYAPEIWYNIPLSRKIALSLCARYEGMKIDLEDAIYFSFEVHKKTLNADLNFYSLGWRLQWIQHNIIRPYLGLNMGYCHGDLETYHDFEAPYVFETTARVNGDGGGIFYDIIAGINVPVLPRITLFGEGDIRFTPGWKRFDNDSVETTGDIDQAEWLLTEDRRLDPLIGWILRLGIQIGIY